MGTNFENPTQKTQPSALRFGQQLGLLGGVALGLGLTLALHGFLVGPWAARSASARMPAAYVLYLLLFLPVALTYVQRALYRRGTQGLFGLVQGEGGILTFMSGWLLLAGYAGLIALLAWGAGHYLSVLLSVLFGWPLAVGGATAACLLLVGLRIVVGGAENGRLRTLTAYGALAAVMAVLVWVWWKSATLSALASPPLSSLQLDLFAAVALLASGLWAVAPVLDRRPTMHRPRRLLLPALLIPFGLGAGLGLLIALTPGYPFVLPVAWADVPRLAVWGKITFMPLMLALAALAVLFAGLNQSFEGLAGLVAGMAGDGFLPENAAATASRRLRLRIFAPAALFAFILLRFLALEAVIGVAVLGLLGFTVLLNYRIVRRPRSETRRLPFRLPFHPLFPGLAMAASLFLTFALPPATQAGLSVWMLAGIGYYVAAARQRSRAVHEQQVAYHRPAAPAFDEDADDYLVLVHIANTRTASTLLRAGQRLAAARGGRLVALYLHVTSEQTPATLRDLMARQRLETLQQLLEQARLPDIAPVTPLVRVARNAADGIVQAVSEEQADLLLLGWEETQRERAIDQVYRKILGDEPPAQPAETEETPDLAEALETIVRAAPCDVAVLRGRFPVELRRILLPSSGGSRPSAALDLSRSLLAGTGGEVVLTHVVEPGKRPGRGLPGAEAGAGDSALSQQIVEADSVKAGILEAARECDLLIMNASRRSFLEADVFGGLPAAVAQARRRPTLLLKEFEGTRRLWLREAWYTLASVFPTLTPSERSEVVADMRQAAQPSINFFVLIVLAATIATLGLLQNSAAVIIGAMLVAPLMSPIVATAMGIVQGDGRLSKTAIEAASKGIVMAIGVGSAITLLAPETAATHEILNRTQPNLLDLVVALASGAAAGYSLSRKEVSAALPGVSIAVALVPPLCVVGFGLAAAQFAISGGAFLLFTTNLIAIILAASIVFLLLGFRPPSRQEHRQFQRGLFVSLASLVLIAIPLAVLLNVSVSTSQAELERQSVETEVRALLAEAIPAGEGRFVDLSVKEGEIGYVIDATIHAFAGFDEGRLQDMDERLTTDLAVPVTFRATILEAREIGGD